MRRPTGPGLAKVLIVAPVAGSARQAPGSAEPSSEPLADSLQPSSERDGLQGRTARGDGADDSGRQAESAAVTAGIEAGV
ncbi:hypothetical protein C2E23DRAFT_815134 [Lenzites betulinus]|nr:hypothetical protein C2E23DRAFT_815134 [Lenzites betulinus]